MANTKPLKILELKEGSSEVNIITENLQIINDALHQSGADVVSIVAVMGTYRTGKSFILDLMTRYLKQKVAKEQKEEAELSKVQLDSLLEKENAGNVAASNVEALLENDDWRLGEDDRNKKPSPSWVREGPDSSRLHEGSTLDEGSSGFAWRPGKDKCTQGIWLWSTPFVFKDEQGKRVAVLLMDTQGAWDDAMTKAQSGTIFGLTALLSSKLIFNIQNRIEEDKLENMDYITTFAQTACRSLPGAGEPFGHLELLVRDWANYDDGFDMKACKGQMDEHLDDHTSPSKVPEDAKDRVERLQSTFRSIGAWGLPHPGLKVTKPNYTGELDVIDHDFLVLLDEFCKGFFGKGFPKASAPFGREMTPDNFSNLVMSFAGAFSDNAQGMAIGLRQAFVKVELITAKEEIFEKFKAAMRDCAPESAVIDPEDLKAETDGFLAKYKEEFEARLKPFKMPADEENAAVGELLKMINEVIQMRVARNSEQVEGATLKLVASPVVGGVGYFFLAHHILLAAAAGGGAYVHANKWARIEGDVELYDPVVLNHMYEDAQKWSLQRYKDVQAIQIAMNRLTPDKVMDTLQASTAQAGVMVAAAAAANHQNEQPQENGHSSGAH